jgi:DNA-binding PadR family transcriptional regulator
VLQDLALPHYHHELVKACVELLFEYPDKAGQLSGLLKQLSEQGVITSTQMAQVGRWVGVC